MRKLVIATLALAALGGYATVPATAGTPDDPEITDPAGDANGISQITGVEEDTRPASIDSADLRAVWLETAFETNRVLDPETGAVLRVEHVPTGLLYHVRTEAPVRPMPSQVSQTRFTVTAEGNQLHDRPNPCWLTLNLSLDAGGSSGDGASFTIPALCREEGQPTALVTGGLEVSVDADIVTASVPFSAPGIDEQFLPGRRLVLGAGSPGINSAIVHESTVGSFVDRARGTGRSFTIGQDVPPDIDCSAEPGHPECQS